MVSNCCSGSAGEGVTRRSRTKVVLDALAPQEPHPGAATYFCAGGRVRDGVRGHCRVAWRLRVGGHHRGGGPHGDGAGCCAAIAAGSPNACRLRIHRRLRAGPSPSTPASRRRLAAARRLWRRVVSHRLAPCPAAAACRAEAGAKPTTAAANRAAS